MSFIKETLARVALAEIRSFILNGAEEFSEERLSYQDKLKIETDPIFARLHRMYPQDETRRDEALAELYQAMTAYQTVYMEIGMKAGARLLHQLLLTNDSENISY